MPSGIIIKSASHEVSDEVRDANVKAVIESAGYEVPEPEPPAQPQRADFKTDEEHEAALVKWEDGQKKQTTKENDEEPAVPRKSRKTRAIERATAEKDRRIKELEAELAAKSDTAPPTRDDAPKEAARPKRADFTDNESYEDALLAWGMQKAVKEKALKDTEAANKSRFEQNIASYAAQVEEAKDKYEDWEEIVNQDIFIGQGAQLAILELPENAAEVIYYLGKHPAYAKKLGEMSEHSAIMEVGRLSQKLLTGAPASGEANGEDQPKPKPKVPAPVRTVNTGGSSGAPTFAEIAARPNYPGKAADLRRAQANSG